MERHWYRSSLTPLTFSLLPFSWLFRSVVATRRFCYRTHLKKSIKFPVPVIVVGNITVGGTGKTPLVVWLANFLKQQGFRPGIVSRGVGGKQQRSPRMITASSQTTEMGDEAILIRNRTQCPMVVGIDRVAAVKTLLANSDCNIVISDDGLQHYRLARDVEIVMVDGERGLGNKNFIPAGPLRESPQRLKQVDFVVKQIGLSDQNHQMDGVVTMQLKGDTLFSVKHSNQQTALTHFPPKKIHAVAAIGNPHRFFEFLRSQGFEIVEHVFPDHHLFRESDFAFHDALPIIMTEKDAVKCHHFADERFWFLPVETVIDSEFGKNVLEKIKSRVDK